MSDFSIDFFGNIRDCRTEAEITLRTDEDDSGVLASVYETKEGWQVEVWRKDIAKAQSEKFTDCVERAKRALTSYVNRKGENPPGGLSAAGLALWLMLKDDGTAMGRSYPD